MSNPLSVQLYTVRDALAANPVAALERLSLIGFTTVEPFDLQADYLRLLPDFGMTAPSAHSRVIGDDVVPVFEAAQAFGIGTVIHPSTTSGWNDSDAVVDLADQLNAVAAIAADIGITVGYHNHWWELESHLDGTTALEAFADNLDPGVILEVDTYWAAVGGVDPVALLERLGDRVRLIHVKDGDISRDASKQTAVGAGRMPVLEVLAAAPTAVRVLELDDYEGDVFDALADSVAFLTANGEQL